MNKRIVIILAAASLLFGNPPLYSAETNSAAADPAVSAEHDALVNALNLLVARIKAKLETGKQDVSDYADIIKITIHCSRSIPKLMTIA